jgi:hypothetical protein
MQAVIQDIVDLSLMRAEVVKKIKMIKGLTLQAEEKAGSIVKRFNSMESELKGYLNVKQ